MALGAAEAARSTAVSHTILKAEAASVARKSEAKTMATEGMFVKEHWVMSRLTESIKQHLATPHGRGLGESADTMCAKCVFLLCLQPYDILNFRLPRSPAI